MRTSRKTRIINTYETDYVFNCPVNGKVVQKVKVNVYGSDETPASYITRVELTKDNEIITS